MSRSATGKSRKSDGADSGNAYATEVQVRRRFRDGWWIYTCEALPGLYVAHQNDRVAYNDIPAAIETLFKIERNVAVNVAHKLSYDGFMNKIAMSRAAREAVEERTQFMASEPTMISFIVGNRAAHLSE